MNQDINVKLEELFTILDNSSLIIEMKKLKDLILKDNDLLAKINIIKTLNKYDPAYLELKLDIYNNSNYKRYIELENNLNLLIWDFNSKLKKLTGEANESN